MGTIGNKGNTTNNKSHPDSPAFEKTRAKIQTTQLVKRLQNYALNQVDDQGNQVELDAGRLKAIDMLLNRALPSLSSTTITGADGGPVIPVLQIFEIEPKTDADESSN
jgi:hypothetical protein